MPYRTWVNNTTPAINANNLNTIQESLGYVSVKDRSLTSGGAAGDGTTDDRAAIQSAIDALPATGGVVYFPVGKYKINASGGIGLDLSSKDSVTLRGEMVQSFNEGGTNGAQLICGSTSMTLVKCDGGGSVKHMGPKFEGINFYSAQASCKLVALKMVNHWAFRECNFAGAGTSLIGLELDVDTGTYPAGDNAYGMLDHCRFSISDSGAYHINALESFGFVAIGCNFNGSTNVTAVRLLKCQDATFMGCKWNYGNGTGNMIYCEGGNNMVVACSFEAMGGGAGYAVKIVRPGGSPLPYQGKRNKFVGCQHVGGYWYDVGTGCESNSLIGFDGSGDTTKVSNSGAYTQRLDAEEAWIAPWSGGKLSTFGATPAAKQTVTGSRGGNAALASLLTALANYGLITDSTS